MSLIRIDKGFCKGCGLCISVCPNQLISLPVHSLNYGYSLALFNDSHVCVGCALCAQMCPDVAISVFKE